MSSLADELLLKTHVRAYVIERDGHVCRGCGQYQEHPHVHHIVYRSQGGKDVPSNLISLCFRCHEMVHRSKPLWMPILQTLIDTPGVNGLQLLRWHKAREANHHA